MGKVNKSNKKHSSRTHRIASHSSVSVHSKSCNKVQHKKGCTNLSGNKDLDNVTCSVCMEFPHNAVLLLCSSHDKGCRPFMCATGYRYSNCLDQYKKANTKVISIKNTPIHEGSLYDPCLPVECLDGKSEVTELLCPLCRGQVKGWTVVSRIRKYLNAKKRACMQDNCSFKGSYKKLKKHMKETHPRMRPRYVDPVLSEKWKKLENDREVEDVYSTIRSTMPGAIIVGDYVIERNYHNVAPDFDTDDFSSDDDDDDDDLLLSEDDDLGMGWGDFTEDHIEPARAPAWGRFGRFDYHRSRIRSRAQSLLGRSRRQQRHGQPRFII